MIYSPTFAEDAGNIWNTVSGAAGGFYDEHVAPVLPNIAGPISKPLSGGGEGGGLLDRAAGWGQSMWDNVSSMDSSWFMM